MTPTHVWQESPYRAHPGYSGTIGNAACGVIAAILVASLALLLLAANAHIGDPLTGATYYPPCTTEDSGKILPCLWNASTVGNGLGRSFIINTDGTTTYLDGGK